MLTISIQTLNNTHPWTNCRVRHDCPTDLEDEEAVTEVITIVGAAPSEDIEDEPEFDDGSFFTFVPEERHRFRLSTPKPREPSRDGKTKKPKGPYLYDIHKIFEFSTHLSTLDI